MKKKVPKPSVQPIGDKAPKFGADPENSEKEKPCWQLGSMDFEGSWTWQKANHWDVLEQIHAKLKNFETMTWAEICRASGGRTAGNNSHFVSVDNIKKEAQQRLAALGHKDVSDVFSLRLAGTQRVWGIRTGRILKVLWWDPNHEIYEAS